MVKGIAALIILTLFCAGNVSAETQSRSAARSLPSSRSELFAVKKGENLYVTSRQGNILISVWERNEASITVEGVDEESLRDLRIDYDGSTVRVDYYPSNSRWARRVRFKIDVPGNFNFDLKTGAGDIEIIGSVNGRIRANTSGGDVSFDDIKGSVDASTSGGDIRTGKIEGEGYLKTSGGDIRIVAATSMLDVATSGGDIKIGDVGKRLDARTSGGNIIIGNVGGEARVNTSGGDIEVGKVSGGARLHTAGGTVRLRSASGVVEAHTAGGDIDLYEISGTIEARTAGGNIQAELMPVGAGRSSLITAGGEISLYIDRNAKATIDARINMDRGFFRATKDSKRSSGRFGYEIRSEFKADQYEEDEKRGEIRAVYTLNGGGAPIYLETSYGNIILRALQPRR